MQWFRGATWFALWTVLLLGGCGAGLPASVRQYAAELPARADGQYALLDPLIRKQLVTKDALLQCRIDLEDGHSEQDSPSCRCAESASLDWLDDCRAWLGAHTPMDEPPEPDEATDEPISIAPGARAGLSDRS